MIPGAATIDKEDSLALVTSNYKHSLILKCFNRSRELYSLSHPAKSTAFIEEGSDTREYLLVALWSFVHPIGSLVKAEEQYESAEYKVIETNRELQIRDSQIYYWQPQLQKRLVRIGWQLPAMIPLHRWGQLD